MLAHAAPPPATPLQTNWVASQSPNHYTLQLVSLSSESSVKKFVAELAPLGQETGYVRYEAKGAIRYAALLGVYPSRGAAEQARSQLPAHLRKNQPWIRNIGELQSLALP